MEKAIGFTTANVISMPLTLSVFENKKVFVAKTAP
jgi:hypothetical protein